MKDKFRENFWIAFPAAAATLILILILSFQTEVQGQVNQSYHLVQVIPYVLVLIGGIIGINVFVVLLIGIVSGRLSCWPEGISHRSIFCKHGEWRFRNV